MLDVRVDEVRMKIDIVHLLSLLVVLCFYQVCGVVLQETVNVAFGAELFYPA